jgi:hypothetical protein
MPFDHDLRRRPLREPFGVLPEGAPRIVAQIGLVVVEEGVGERMLGIQIAERRLVEEFLRSRRV